MVVGQSGNRMNVSRAMLECAAAARPWLGRSVGVITTFIAGRMDTSGGFVDRAGSVDLYYTMFGVDCLLALGGALPPGAALKEYLLLSVRTQELDLLHLAALARCWSRVGAQDDRGGRDVLAARIRAHRAADGGYGAVPGAGRGSMYACFLAVSGLSDLQCRVVDDGVGVLACVEGLAGGDGCYVEFPGVAPSTNAAVGAVLLQRVLGVEPEPETLRWIGDRYDRSGGGFVASQDAPAPDLVSTATALFALRCAGMDLGGFRDGCREFVGGLWDPSGGFCGHWMDETPDCEYTFDALLALGCLES